MTVAAADDYIEPSSVIRLDIGLTGAVFELLGSDSAGIETGTLRRAITTLTTEMLKCPSLLFS